MAIKTGNIPKTDPKTAGCADFQEAANLGDENAKQALIQYCR